MERLTITRPGQEGHEPGKAHRVALEAISRDSGGSEQAEQGATALPRQKRTNSTETDLTPYQMRAKFSLSENVKKACAEAPDRSYFLTLTVGNYKNGRFTGLDDAKEVSRRWNSLREKLTGWLGAERMLIVPERHKSGNWHLHCLVITRTSFHRNWKHCEYLKARKAAKSGATGKSRAIYRRIAKRNPRLAARWRQLRSKLPLYGFGRHEFIPVQKPEAAGEYLGKYLGKAVGKNGRVTTRYCGDWRKLKDRTFLGFVTVRGWSWSGKGGRIHRLVIGSVAVAMGLEHHHDWQSSLNRAFGSKWCFVIWSVWTGSIEGGFEPFQFLVALLNRTRVRTQISPKSLRLASLAFQLANEKKSVTTA